VRGRGEAARKTVELTRGRRPLAAATSAVDAAVERSASKDDGRKHGRGGRGSAGGM